MLYILPQVAFTSKDFRMYSFSKYSEKNFWSQISEANRSRKIYLFSEN